MPEFCQAILHLTLIENCCGDVTRAADNDGDPHLPSPTVSHWTRDARVVFTIAGWIRMKRSSLASLSPFSWERDRLGRRFAAGRLCAQLAVGCLHVDSPSGVRWYSSQG